jgi:antirestriction protein ArdC
MARDLAYQIMTDRIINLLEQGTVPWHRPWDPEVGFPRNLMSKKYYRGINVLMLGTQHYDSPWWLSFPKQLHERGGTLRQGEKLSYVVFWTRTQYPKEIPETGEIETRAGAILKFYKVVNLRQCEGINPPVLEEEPRPDRDHTPIKACEALIAAIPNPPAIRYEATQAFYAPASDTIYMPRPERFDSPEMYYSTLYHELVHSAGHLKRLNRPTLKDAVRFGDPCYCKEELVAEMGAAFLCGVCEIANRTVNNSAAYITGWLAKLRQDNRLLVHAAAQAQRAADYLRGITWEE